MAKQQTKQNKSLDLSKTDPTAPLEVTTNGKQPLASPVHRKSSFAAAQRMAHTKYGTAFKKLAE